MGMPNRVIGLHHFSFTVVDLDRTVQFYRDLLDFQVRSISDYQWDADFGVAVFGDKYPEVAETGVKARIAIMELNGTRVDFMQMIEPKTTPSEPHIAIAGSSHMGIKVKDIQETRRRLLEAGVRSLFDVGALTEPGAHRWQWCPFLDPEGITVEIVEEPPVTTLTETLGLRIRQARGVRGLTLKEVAALCDISAAHLSQVERGDALPSIPVLIAISSALAVPPDYFLRLEEAADWPGIAVMDGTLKTAEECERPEASSDGAHLLPADGGGGVCVSGDVDWHWLTTRGQNVSVYQGQYGVGSSSYDLAVGQTGTETMVVLEGTFRVQVGDASHLLDAGSSISYERSIGRSFSNSGDEPAVGLWIIVPGNPPAPRRSAGAGFQPLNRGSG